MENKFLSFLKKGDFISFRHKDWDFGDDYKYSGHRFNQIPCYINRHCFFDHFSDDFLFGVETTSQNPFLYTKVVKPKRFKKDNITITEIQRYSQKLGRWVVIYEK